MIKQLYFLSGLAIFNLTLVTIIANASVSPQAGYSVPTPQTIITRVIKKIQRFEDDDNRGGLLPISKQPVNTSSTVPSSSSCIITVDGVKFDITQYQYLHSGGDIFTCGSDMSSLFWNQHNQKQLNQLQKYRI